MLAHELNFFLEGCLSERVYGSGALRFECADGGLLVQDVAQFVDAFEQASLGEAVHRKFDRPAILQRQRLIRQVDLYSGIRMRKKPCMHIARHDDRQQTILERIAFEYVSK